MINSIVRIIQRLRTTRMCFVAGTMVATGLIGSAAVIHEPIESIQAGDLVWSRNEATGEVALKPVVETFVTRPTELVEIQVDGNGDGDPEESITGTVTHPFWNPVEENWIEMGDLNSGDTLLLLDGRKAQVFSANRSHAPPGEQFFTYNFEVAEFHTYFIGEAGVWVHNAGASCERAFSIFERSLRLENGDHWLAYHNALDRFPPVAAEGTIPLQTFNEVRRRYFDEAANGLFLPVRIEMARRAESRRLGAWKLRVAGC